MSACIVLPDEHRSAILALMLNNRSIADFRAAAVLHWPDDIRDEVAQISVLPLLLDTQDHFLGLLILADRTPDAWKQFLAQTDKLSGSLLLKHVMVLADLGGEALNKLVPLDRYFENGAMKYVWRGAEYEYIFKTLHVSKTADNSKLGVTEKKIAQAQNGLSAIAEDVIMLILHGGAAIDASLPSEVSEKCILGQFLGKPDELKNFVRQAYLRVSRQVQGGVANALGAVTQRYVRDLLAAELQGWEVAIDRPLPGVTHRIDGVGTNFDVRAVSPRGQHFGVEVSFQVTTNSTIERKSRESAAIQRAAHRQGHKVCYVIDGAGNINVRDHAIQTLFDNSDMTVAFSPAEIGLLARYMREETGE